MQFFPKHRRELTLNGAVMLKKKLFRLDFVMLLSTSNLREAPHSVNEAYGVIAKQDSGVDSATVEPVHSQTLQLWTLPEQGKGKPKDPEYVIENVDLKRLVVFRPPSRSEDTPCEDVFLKFSTIVPRSARLVRFAHEQHDHSVFVKFLEVQQEIEKPEAPEAEQTTIPDVTMPAENKEAVAETTKEEVTFPLKAARKGKPRVN